MAREYSKGSVTVYRGKWRARLRWREDGGKWQEKNGYLTEYEDHGARRQLLPPKATGTDDKGKPVYKTPKSVYDALAQWRDKVIADDEAEAERQEAERIERERMEAEAAAKAEAERIAAEEAERRARDPREKLKADTAYCVSWYVEKWASDDSVEASTTRGYRTLAKRIAEATTEDGAPYFNGVPLDQVTASAIQQWEMEQRRSGLSSVTIKKRVNLLRAVYREATDTSDGQEPLTRNFPFPDRNRRGKLADRRAAKKTEKSRSDINAYDQDEYDEALSILIPRGLEAGGWVEAAGVIMLLTGMRRQEVCALRWRSIDFDSHYLTVEDAVGLKDRGEFVQGVPKDQQTEGTYIKSLKTGAESRTIKMLSTLEVFLKQLWQNQQSEIREANARYKRQFNEGREVPEMLSDLYRLSEDSFIVGDVLTGKWHSPDTLTHKWGAVSKTLPKGNRGRYCTPYDLRHSFATELVRNGVDEYKGSEILGNSPQVFRDNYISPSQKQSDKAIEQIESAMEERERERKRLSRTVITFKTGTND